MWWDARRFSSREDTSETSNCSVIPSRCGPKALQNQQARPRIATCTEVRKARSAGFSSAASMPPPDVFAGRHRLRGARTPAQAAERGSPDHPLLGFALLDVGLRDSHVAALESEAETRKSAGRSCTSSDASSGHGVVSQPGNTVAQVRCISPRYAHNRRLNSPACANLADARPFASSRGQPCKLTTS